MINLICKLMTMLANPTVKMHTYYIPSVLTVGTRLCIRSILLCDWTSITTSRCDAVSLNTTGKTWHKVLYQHTMYVLSLSNISTTKFFFKITRVELKLTTFRTYDVALFVAVHSPKSRYCSIIFSITVQSSSNAFLEKCGP
jgi:hypothetical protein